MTDLQERSDAAAAAAGSTPDVDVVVVGAGMAGLYLLKRLRDLGLRARAFETGDDVGGTWYWNRYPGARCDVESIDYQYTWDPDLLEEWTWSERYATQPEILRYIEYVADKHDLRRDITFSTRIVDARWNDDDGTWTIRTEPADGTDDGEAETLTCRWYVMATGCLSAPKDPDVEGADEFEGDVYVTGRWPHDGVDFTGQRVAVIGTGSSGIQSIPLIADEADELVVFQRTPNFSIPARNGPPRPEKLAQFEGREEEYREEARWSGAGVPRPIPEVGALQVDDDARRARYEEAWEEATILSLTGAFNDIILDADANETVSEFVREKIRERVDDPETAEALCPTTFPLGTKRLCLDTNYYETFNREHVSLVDLRREPIRRITTNGIELATPDGGAGRSFEFDSIVFATGFDAMTGAIVRVDIEGRDGRSLRDEWAAGPRTYLGLMSHGFPNLFMITGPQSPSVLSNMVMSIEQHVDWIVDALAALEAEGRDVIEPTETAQQGWVDHANDFAGITLFPQANSWYVGANVPGKARAVMPYCGGLDRYRQACIDAVEQGYLGFRRAASDGSVEEVVHDGIVREVAPDVAIMLDLMAELGVPPVETMSPTDARAFMEASAAMNPPGPEVAEVTEGTYPGADGDLAYRRYVPAGTDTSSPSPIVLYLHGGGWVLGSAESDDAFCRDLADRTGAIVVSADYRHAPEARFPAAHDDAWAALRWIAGAAGDLGGDPDRLAVAGWSAGANLAGHVAQRARDEGGPSIVAQLLVTPVTDGAMATTSYRDNAEGYVLTASLMAWFMGHYADEAERADPRLSILHADDLSGLPPAVVLTAQFDPLRDEGDAYAAALAEAGGEVTHVRADGQIHTSFTAVSTLITPAAPRADALTAFARHL